ncbi:uncharacterized protein LOC119081612 isoform X2 [Bradysia coprophila]|uniref:uncharacterized protein LOC119081612 isoform X2 n=1 Tax=Bradysia coprophila TaxID=38358 RepID=UPI00187DC701|nr:uncharacterized protein LOC119081612 isoform X2 [Bradysia coprophila]
MSDNKEILKNLGLHNMLISPDFTNFTRWFCELTEENHLSEEEIVKINELKSAGTFIDDIDLLNQRINEVFEDRLTDLGEIEELQDEYNDLKDTEEALENMLSAANATELKMDEELNRLNSDIQADQMNIESLTQNSQADAQFLEDLTTRNIENRCSFLTSFSSQLSHPMRWCRLDYDNYLVGCDNFSLSMKMIFEKTLKLRDSSSFVEEDPEHNKRLYDLFTLQNTFTRTASALHEAESDLYRIDAIIDALSKPVQSMSPGLMSEQIEQLTWQNAEMEENLENLESLIQEKIAQLGYQEAKFCEVENNREKLVAAEKRVDIMKKCAASISENLLLTEVLCLMVNLEKETMNIILDSVASAHYEEENEQCASNLEILTKISSNSMADHVGEEFSEQVAEMIADDIVADSTISEEPANPFAKYAERVNHFAVQLEDIISDSYQIKIADSIKDFNGISAHLNAFIGNGPSHKPNIWNLPVLAESEIYKRKFDLMFDLSRMMRHNFMEKYHQPFMNDELWKRRQLLWIWFLTDEEAFLEAFQKTVADSKRTANHGNVSFGGLKRNQ